MGSMPVWEEDGVKVCQSSAILRMLGIRLGYYSEDAMTIWAIDSLVDFAEDNQGKFGTWVLPTTQGAQIDMSKEAEWLAGGYGKVIPIYEKRLAAHGKRFLAGTDRPTIADFKAFQHNIGFSDVNPATPIPRETLDKINNMIAASPAYARWVDAMKQELANYLPTRPPRPL